MKSTPLAAVEWTDVASAWSDMIMVVLTLATLAGVVYVAAQVALQRKQLHRDLENLYVERYWAIMDRLESTQPDSPERQRAVLSYLGLSEDQCDLRALGRVTGETWGIWGRSIHGALEEAEYAQALACSPSNRFAHLRELIVDGAEYDPIDLTLRQQKWRGL